MRGSRAGQARQDAAGVQRALQRLRGPAGAAVVGGHCMAASSAQSQVHGSYYQDRKGTPCHAWSMQGPPQERGEDTCATNVSNTMLQNWWCTLASSIDVDVSSAHAVMLCMHT
jgi:hypothetical protein